MPGLIKSGLRRMVSRRSSRIAYYFIYKLGGGISASLWSFVGGQLADVKAHNPAGLSQRLQQGRNLVPTRASRLWCAHCSHQRRVEDIQVDAYVNRGAEVRDSLLDVGIVTPRRPEKYGYPMLLQI